MVADPPRLLSAQRYRADVQLLDVIDRTDGELLLLGKSEAAHAGMARNEMR